MLRTLGARRIGLLSAGRAGMGCRLSSSKPTPPTPPPSSSRPSPPPSSPSQPSPPSPPSPPSSHAPPPVGPPTRNPLAQRWTEEEDERLIKARNDGLHVDNIHQDIFPHRSVAALRARLYKLDKSREMAEWLEQRRQSGAGLRLHPNLRAGPGPPGTLRARFAERREAENTLNPFTLPVKITHLLAEWTAFGKRVAVVDQPVEGFELPPKGSAESPPMDLVLRLEKGALGTVLGALGSSTGDVKVKATMTIEVDGVKADVDFTLGNEDIAPKVANVTPLTK